MANIAWHRGIRLPTHIFRRRHVRFNDRCMACERIRERDREWESVWQRMIRFWHSPAAYCGRPSSMQTCYLSGAIANPPVEVCVCVTGRCQCSRKMFVAATQHLKIIAFKIENCLKWLIFFVDVHTNARIPSRTRLKYVWYSVTRNTQYTTAKEQQMKYICNAVSM